MNLGLIYIFLLFFQPVQTFELVDTDYRISSSEKCDNYIELVTNGSFEDGNTGFSSGLVEDCSCAWSSYCVASNAKDKCSNNLWNPIPPSSGQNYLIVDGKVEGNGTFWMQDIQITEGIEYTFSFDYFPDISGSGLPTIQVELIDPSTQNIITTLVSSINGTSGTWTTHSHNWESNFTGEVLIKMKHIDAPGWSDFGIDNIKFGHCEDCNKNNLVVNGGFEDGNTGFSSGLVEDCSCAWSSYCVASNAKDKCSNNLWNPIPPSSGQNYLIVDGKVEGNGTFWMQDIQITEGIEYTFSFDYFPDISNDGQPSILGH